MKRILDHFELLGRTNLVNEKVLPILCEWDNATRNSLVRMNAVPVKGGRDSILGWGGGVKSGLPCSTMFC